MKHDHDKDDTRKRPDPHEDPDTASIGSTDERSSENRREGLKKDGEDVNDNRRD